MAANAVAQENTSAMRREVNVFMGSSSGGAFNETRFLGELIFWAAEWRLLLTPTVTVTVQKFRNKNRKIKIGAAFDKSS